MAETAFDLVLFGASSFVGKILARYLLQQQANSGTQLKWAIAGRSRAKLEKLQRELGPNAKNLPVLIADAADSKAVKALCNQTQVIISTVGPYALYGEPLIKACAETGTHYCDLTGEVQWIARMLEKYESIAADSGAYIVNCCGFDSIPSDLGVYHLQQHSITSLGHYCENIKMRVSKIKGGVSGGTVASIVNIAREAGSDPQLRKLLSDPYALCPAGTHKVKQAKVSRPRLDPDFNQWMAPFIMSGINTPIVLRSNILQGSPYSQNFHYDEALLTGKNQKGRRRAWLTTAGLSGFILGASLKPSRWFLESFVLPKPGKGPSPEQQARGLYQLDFIGKTQNGGQIHTQVIGDQDPGYGSTAKILGQAALCLAFDIPATNPPGGFWTPASLMGTQLIKRLESHAGVNFKVINSPPAL